MSKEEKTQEITYYHGYLYYYKIPIGPCDLTQEQIAKIHKDKGYTFIRDKKFTVMA